MPKFKVYRIIEADSRDDARKKFREEVVGWSEEWPDHIVNQFFIGEIPN